MTTNKTEAAGDMMFHRGVAYDSLRPEESLRSFLDFTRAVLMRYKENGRLLAEYEKQTQDLLHYIELHENLSAARGFAMYTKLRNIRRARRVCKDENELLKPLVDFLISGKSQTDQLAKILGSCRAAREAIDARQYRLRTDVLREEADSLVQKT